ncbi:MAG: hypothetical protein WB565_09925 [Acidimicrobiales bacterium]
MAEPSSYNGPAEIWSEGEIRFPEVQVRLGSDTEVHWAGQVISGIPLKDISDITELEVIELKLPNNEARQIVFPEPDNLRFDGTGTPPWV